MIPRIRVWRSSPRNWAWRHDCRIYGAARGVYGYASQPEALASACRHWITQHAWEVSR